MGDYAKIVAVFQNPVILDNKTHLDKVLISRLDNGWLVLDRTFRKPRSVFLKLPPTTPCGTMEEVILTLAPHNEGRERKLDGTLLALIAWLAHHKENAPLPAELDMEPIRLQLCEAGEPPHKKKRTKEVVVIE